MNSVAYEILVDPAYFSTLILAVHDVASGERQLTTAARWRYGNMIGIGRPLVKDLEPSAARIRHGLALAPTAAITVVTQRKISVDVLFAFQARDASALFVASPSNVGEMANMEGAWAEFLASRTAAVLASAGVDVRQPC